MNNEEYNAYANANQVRIFFLNIFGLHYKFTTFTKVFFLLKNIYKSNLPDSETPSCVSQHHQPPQPTTASKLCLTAGTEQSKDPKIPVRA